MMSIIRKFPLDLTAEKPDNFVAGEPHRLVTTNNGKYRLIIPNYGSFFTRTVALRDENGLALEKDVDYFTTLLHQRYSTESGYEVCGALAVVNPNVSDKVFLDYHVVGGDASYSVDALEQVLAFLNGDDKVIEWGNLVGRPDTYAPAGHLHALWELYGFEYLITQMERITQAILTGNQASLDELRQYAFALYEDGKAYTDLLEAKFNDHKNNTSNPHQVTKAQVGLGLVENFPIATAREGEIGTATNRYMHVAGVVAAIDYHLGRQFRAHRDDTNNPHSVTKAQVGLGSVQNYGIATQVHAEQGTEHARYMTPLRTAQAIDFQIGAAHRAHLADTNNPHSVTKTQVGLGNVLNYGVATKTEAELGVIATKYMTPLRTKDALQVWAIDPLNGHIADKGNPHSVTKAQVGLGSVANYSVASTSEAQAGKTNVRYMTPLRTAEAITSQVGVRIDAHIDDKGNPHAVTKAQVGLGLVQNYSVASIAQAQAGTATERYMTPFLTAEAITALVGSAFNAHVADVNNPHSVTKAQVGLGSVLNYGVATLSEAREGTLNTRYMTPLRVANAIATQAGALVNNHINDKSNPHQVTKAQVGLGLVQNYGVATIAEAQAGTETEKYMTPFTTAAAITSRVGNSLTSHISNLSNPHQVTKAQVGLGNVQNYGIATQGEARAGTATNKYMTPLRTAEAISSLAGDLLGGHADLRNNPHNVTKAQVGLSLVQNYAISTTTQARAGTDNERYMTPLRTAEAISSQVGSSLTSHISNVSNPHSVTKAQVGLGQVDNYATATQEEARVGVLNTRFMTPLRTKDAIEVQVGTAFNNHANAKNNPHAVTKAQVGLGSVPNYGISTQYQAQMGTVHDRFMTPLRTADAITHQVGNQLTGHIGNKSNPHNVTKAQVGLGSVANYGVASTTEAREGSVNDKYMTPLRTAEAIAAMAGGLVGGHAGLTNNPHNVTKGQVGLGSVENYGIASIAQARLGTVTTRYMTPALVAEAITYQIGTPFAAHTGNTSNPHNVTKAQVGLSNVPNFGMASYTEGREGTAYDKLMSPARVAQAITLQGGALVSAHADLKNNPHAVTAAQVGLSQVENYTIATQAIAEAGVLNTRYMTPLRTKEAIAALVGTAFNSHASATNNPHSVTKAQVGLGSVPNYGISSITEAREGSVHDKLMTPLRTANAIATQAGALVANHADKRDNPHNVTKEQVGLSQVSNFRIASWTEAREATSNDLYMTPQRTADAFSVLFERHVTNGFSMPRTGSSSTIHFGTFKSDHAFISHYVGGEETPGDARFRFCVSDDGAEAGGGNDRFEFGATDSKNGDNWVNWLAVDQNRILSRGDVRAYSDGRLKKNFRGWDDPLAMLTKMRGGVYDRTDMELTQVGVIAQEMMEVLPEVVALDEESDRYSVAYGNLTAFLIETCKALLQRVEALEGAAA